MSGTRGHSDLQVWINDHSDGRVMLWLLVLHIYTGYSVLISGDI